MSEDNKQGDTAQATADAQATDYEAQYKALQAEHEKTVRERDEAVSQVDLLSDYVDWDKVRGEDSSGSHTTQQATQSQGNKPDLEQRLSQKETMLDAKIMALEFRMKNPDLAEYETTLVSPTVARLRRQHPRTPGEKLLEMAAAEVRGFLQKEREKAMAAADEKRKAEVNASGLDSDSRTSPTDEPAGESYDDYIAKRKARQEKLQSTL